MTGKSSGSSSGGRSVVLRSGLVATLLFGACDGVPQAPSPITSERPAASAPTDQTMSRSPVYLAKSFSREEITAAARLLVQDEVEAQQLVEMLMEGKHGALLDVDDEFLTLLGLMSDDLTLRVGELRGLTPDQARAWAGAILEEDGHPSTWKFEPVDEDDEDPPSD